MRDRLRGGPNPDSGGALTAVLAADEAEECRLEVAVHVVIQAIVWRMTVEEAERAMAATKGLA